jgi:CRISPR system Cascade subunit CasD
LGMPWMDPEKAGWTTRGAIAVRGGASSDGTHIRYRHFRADSVHTVALSLQEGGPPSLDEVLEGLRHPARPLFLGRKCCLPAEPVARRIVEAESLLGALKSEPRATRADDGPLPAWWWEGSEEAPLDASRVVPVSDERDWENQVHVGRRLMREGLISPPGASHG